jgi:4-diphosphocytidyl-2-C-methyl-D-erythritol kinase
MLSERRADAVVVWAPAKVNLFLEVLSKRDDGYHEIATLMVAVSLYDTLEFKEEASSAIQLRCDHPNLSPGPDNLVSRAAELLRRRTGCRRGASIRLVKRIPLAAGLAGGSSDAAATLAGLNRMWRLGRPATELADWAADLGSDVPFFFATPAAWCTGRGERVTAQRLGRPLWFVLARPDAGLATADVYRGIAVPEQPLTGDAMRQAVAAGDVDAVGRELHNRLEPAAERLCPALARVRDRLERLRPAGQRMSGSGTSLFALGRDHADALRIARELRHGLEEGVRLDVFLVRSCI